MSVRRKTRNEQNHRFCSYPENQQGLQVPLMVRWRGCCEYQFASNPLVQDLPGTASSRLTTDSCLKSLRLGASLPVGEFIRNERRIAERQGRFQRNCQGVNDGTETGTLYNSTHSEVDRLWRAA